MTSGGGTNSKGAVIKITAAGSETVLYSFGSVPGDGAYPDGSLIQASDGNFYAMASGGGANSVGAVIKITPAGIESVLYSFGTTGDGEGPVGNLTQASDGNFYAMTTHGGAKGRGAVIKVTLAGIETVLHSFGVTSNNDGAYPKGSLIQASDGNLYGMAGNGVVGYGAVIEITLAGAESVVYSFGGTSVDGQNPHSGSLIQALDANLYGMTYQGGVNGAGAVIKFDW